MNPIKKRNLLKLNVTKRQEQRSNRKHAKTQHNFRKTIYSVLGKGKKESLITVNYPGTMFYMDRVIDNNKIGGQ